MHRGCNAPGRQERIVLSHPFDEELSNGQGTQFLLFIFRGTDDR
jgi:hypothetical protein